MVDEPEQNLESVYHSLTGNRANIATALAKSEVMEAILAVQLEKFQAENLNVIELELQIAQQSEMTARLKHHLIEIQEELKKFSPADRPST